MPHCWNSSKKYHTVGIAPKNTTLLEQLQCGIFWSSSNSVVFFGAVPTVWYFLELFQKCGIFWSCSNSVVFFGAIPKSGIFWSCSNSVVYFALLEQLQKIPHCWNNSKIYHTVGTAPKYTTLLEQLQNIPHCWNSSKIYLTVGTAPKYTFWSYSNSVVFFGAVPTVWYFLELFQQCGIF
jgi:hypothetical protein